MRTDARGGATLRLVTLLPRILFLLAALSGLGCNPAPSSAPATPSVRSADAVPRDHTAPGEKAIRPSVALPAADPREAIIAAGVRELLQSEHLRARPIDDAISKQAFGRFIERLDPGKFFLLKSQVAALRRYETQLDDQLKAGDLILGREGMAILDAQRTKVAKMVSRVLAKPFDLTKEEFLETDGEKRDFVESDSELEDRWRRHLKLQVLERIARMEHVLEARREREAKAKQAAAQGNKGAGKSAGKQASKKPLEQSVHPQSEQDEEDDTYADEALPTTTEGKEEKARGDLATLYAGRFSRLSTPQPLEPVEAFVNAIAGVFDPHTHYLAPDDQANFDIQMSGSLEGIGAVLTESDHYIEIREVVPGGAAWRQGELETGDLILSVKQATGEAVDVADMRLSQVVKLIRGPKGTRVTLTVRKPDERVTSIEITRDVVVVEASYARGALLSLGKGGGAVGYIYLPSFYGNTRIAPGQTPERNAVDDVRALLKLFSKKKVSGVVLDLRGNGGGLLSQANDITGLFIESGPVVQARGSGDRVNVIGDEDPKVYFEGPVVALVDRFSASASEILAGALQDYRRALVVGTGPTHGKGTVQMLVDLNRLLPTKGKSLGVLKLTTQQYFLVDGESTQTRGVQPDVVLPDPASFVESGERYLDNAIPWSKTEALPHRPWSKSSWDVAALASRSRARQAEQQVFAMITKRAAHLKERRDDTRVPLQLKAWKARREREDAALEALDPKLDEQPALFSVDVVEYRPKHGAPKRQGGDPDAHPDTHREAGKRIAAWRKNLGRDLWVAESLNLLRDVRNAGKQGGATTHAHSAK